MTVAHHGRRCEQETSAVRRATVHGLLPHPTDKQLLHVETWMHHRLAALADDDSGWLLRQYAT